MEQAKLWALRTVLRKQCEDDDQFQWMADEVHVVGGGHPTRQSVREFFARVDEDAAGWYPGRATKKTGRPVEMTPLKRKSLASSMMAAKKRGMLPKYDTAIALCPRASFNDATQAPFSRQRINALLTSDCYDENPDRPWEFRYGAKRRALSPDDRALRADWAERLLGEGKTAAWFRDNIVWVDICSKVIPGTPSKALDQQQAAQNKKKRLMSAGSSNTSPNLGGTSTADKQCSFGDTRIYFGVALTRGMVGVVVWTEKGEFPGEKPEGASLLVERLPALLNKMLGSSARKPRTIFTDRGPGFYHRTWGTITGDYESACKEHGFKPWQGTNAKKGPHAQPGDIGDVLLHETAISWMRRREEATRPTKPWEETPHDVAERLQSAVRHVNSNFEVRALCMEFPQRLHDIVNKTAGDRLPK